MINRIHPTQPGTRSAGFSLMELVAVMVIIAILATLAYPSYLGYVRKSKRAIAKNALLDAANREEQYFFSKGAYTDVLSDLNYADPAYFGEDGTPSSDTEAIYKLVLTAVNSGSGACGTAPCFQLQAEPQNDQSNDAACGTFTLTSSNAKGAARTDCW